MADSVFTEDMTNQLHSRTISWLRHELQLTGSAAAKLFGVSRAKIENVERGKAKIDPVFAAQIQAATGASSKSLLSGDRPVKSITGEPLTLDLFNKWRSHDVSSSNKETQKQDLKNRVEWLLAAADVQGPAKLRGIYQRLSSVMDEMREEYGISFADIATQARRTASITSHEMTASELLKILKDSPAFQIIYPMLPKRGAVKVLVEKFQNWEPLGDLVQMIAGDLVVDASTQETTIFRIEIKGRFHDVSQTKLNVSGVGRPKEN